MPRSDRGLRRSYFLRQIVEGDVTVPYQGTHDSGNLSSLEQKAEFYPVNYYERERVRDFTRSPRRVATATTVRSSSPEVLKSSKRIRWNESGDSIRTFSPERLRPHSADYVTDVKTPPKQPSVKKRKKVKKPRSKSEEKVNAERQKEQRRRELSAERRRREETKLKQEAERRRRAQQDIEAAKRREAAKKESRENSKRFNQKKTKSKPTVVKTVKRSNSIGNHKYQTNSKPKHSSNSTGMRRAKSVGEIRFHEAKRTMAPKMKKPRWNYVGDPTRKAFNTKVHHVVSDFYF
ncbi:unnamed protein product [Auanema sp. JU1783]|nr:unnamed protein product [Auanema sp. JU1783]